MPAGCHPGARPLHDRIPDPRRERRCTIRNCRKARRPRPSAGRSGRAGGFSSILEALPEAVEGDRISFGDLVDAFDVAPSAR